MSYFESILLGLVQGLGEFLPISSSAHLVIAPWLFNFKDPGLTFDVALHLGTLIAVLAYFWRDWWDLTWGSLRHVRGMVQGSSSESVQARADASRFWMMMALIIATIPAALAGIILNDWAETTLRHPLLVAFNMMFMGMVLFWVDSRTNQQRPVDQISIPLALLIGVAQACALFPGVSRSGATISMALFLGFSRSSAARFSFLLSTPIILGACVLKMGAIAQIFANPQALVGVAVAAITGFLSITYLMKLVQNYSYLIFVWYRLAFSIVVATLFFLRG